jgi:hypothetical protein
MWGGFGLVIGFIGLLNNSWLRFVDDHHRLLFLVAIFTNRCSVVAPNRGCFPPSGYPKCPRPQLLWPSTDCLQSFSLDWLVIKSKSHCDWRSVSQSVNLQTGGCFWLFNHYSYGSCSVFCNAYENVPVFVEAFSLCYMNRSVGIPKGYLLDDRCSFPGRRKKLFCSLQRPDQLWGPLNFLTSNYWGLS